MKVHYPPKLFKPYMLEWQHVISPYSNTAESFFKVMRIKEMIINLRSIDLQMNSLFQYHKKHTKNSMENMDTDVRVSRVKHLHIQWYNTCIP